MVLTDLEWPCRSGHTNYGPLLSTRIWSAHMGGHYTPDGQEDRHLCVLRRGGGVNGVLLVIVVITES